MRQITEVRDFSPAELEKLAQFAAKIEIVGGMYVGEFVSQRLEWLPDGSLRVLTDHTPASIGAVVQRAVERHGLG